MPLLPTANIKIDLLFRKPANVSNPVGGLWIYEFYGFNLKGKRLRRWRKKSEKVIFHHQLINK